MAHSSQPSAAMSCVCVLNPAPDSADTMSVSCSASPYRGIMGRAVMRARGEVTGA